MFYRIAFVAVMLIYAGPYFAFPRVLASIQIRLMPLLIGLAVFLAWKGRLLSDE